MSILTTKCHIDLLVNGEHPSPKEFLGIHSIGSKKIVRQWKCGSLESHILVGGKKYPMDRVNSEGLFTYTDGLVESHLDYRLESSLGFFHHDIYGFDSLISLEDQERLKSGSHYEIYNILGSQFRKIGDVEGVAFHLWAPKAKSVSIVGDFNLWNERMHPMHRSKDSAYFELFIPHLSEGMTYQFVVVDAMGVVKRKSDPHAFYYEKRPNQASILAKVDDFKWNDAEWIEKRDTHSILSQPMNIYEVHLGSWLKRKKRVMNYSEVASELAKYCIEMGYTHVELMPMQEHPLDESWGYQVSGFFAPTSRYGSIWDFQYMINHLHMYSIGVILDWVPGHFPSDSFSLSSFGADSLYEKDDPLMGWHPEWKTKIFDYEKKEVCNFLIGSALFWCDKMHIDGLRVDAVQSMIYLDYARDKGNWKPNKYGGKEDLAAVEFLKHFNHVVHEKFPGVVTIAEDASLHGRITEPSAWGGLAFDLKWNIGWMNDSLSYMSTDPLYRKCYHDQLLATYDRAFDERTILPLSHDEVVHEKKSLYSKMPLSGELKLAQLRLYYSYVMAHPGKKLFFMGLELAQEEEWCFKKELPWNSLRDKEKQQFHSFIRKMNQLYLRTPSLWERDFTKKGFEWIDYRDYNHSIISFLRKGVKQKVLCVHNFSGASFKHYILPLCGVTNIKLLMNTDSIQYGGNKAYIKEPMISKEEVTIELPALTTLIFEVEIENQKRVQGVS